MFFQHKLKPKELSKVISNVEECFFTISAKSLTRSYQVAVYKYQEKYFVLKDPRVFEQIEEICSELHGDEEEVLSYIEQAMEDNLYFVVKEGYVRLDLDILSHGKPVRPIEVKYYEFFDI